MALRVPKSKFWDHFSTQTSPQNCPKPKSDLDWTIFTLGPTLITTPQQYYKESSHNSKNVHICRECNTETRFIEEGANVVECNPTTKTICTPKTRYEPEEYLDDECTTTTEEVCKTNYVRTEMSTVFTIIFWFSFHSLNLFRYSGHCGEEVQRHGM